VKNATGVTGRHGARVPRPAPHPGPSLFDRAFHPRRTRSRALRAAFRHGFNAGVRAAGQAAPAR
jgi:hypothetical protein